MDAFRLVIRSGVRPMLGYFLAWAVVTFLASYVWIFLRDYVLGPHSLAFWQVIDEPLNLVTDGWISFCVGVNRYSPTCSVRGPAA